MADEVQLNRQAFASPAAPPPKSPIAGLFVPLIVIVAILVCGFIGYKMITQAAPSAPQASAQQLAQIQKQLAELEKRMDRLERRRSLSASAAAKTAAIAASAQAPAVSRAPQTASHPGIARAGKAQTASESQPVTQKNPSQHAAPAARPDLPQAQSVASREEWKATADQLADVVDTIGTQQSEISRHNSELQRLSGESQRTALAFTLRRGASPERVGPIAMQLKKSDARSQRYTLYVYVNDRRIVFSDRAADEIIDFAPSPNAAPMRLIAAKISGDAISGYLEVPPNPSPQR